ncbi:MAG TPA: tryptophan--tRNA ligase [Candidatus Acidoferrum sp.]|nr:tryptophan--tRNA ligase [Candidatus Acidoferrum sp.]
MKDRILTGLRANGEFHLGNYLGAILPMVELQRRYAGAYFVNMFVPDLHSFTTPIDHSKLYRQTIDNLKLFVAAGLDINNVDTFIYRQSFVPAHSELAWILDCFTGFGELSRMTQFKDKSSEMGPDENVSAGLFNYPVLMAADILLYEAAYVPVGDDQRQHLELTRDLALRLNHKFKQELFIPPADWNGQLKFAQRDSGVRVRSLRNPEKKMSKSVSDPSGTIMLSDDPAEAAKKVMRAETDSFGEIQFDFAKRPGISNLLQMLALLGGQSQEDVNSQWAGKTSYGDLKSAAADRVQAFLAGLQTKLANVDEVKLLAKLEHDEAMMRKIANKTLLRVQQAVGLRNLS